MAVRLALRPYELLELLLTAKGLEVDGIMQQASAPRALSERVPEKADGLLSLSEYRSNSSAPQRASSDEIRLVDCRQALFNLFRWPKPVFQ